MSKIWDFIVMCFTAEFGKDENSNATANAAIVMNNNDESMRAFTTASVVSQESDNLQ